MAKSAGSVRFTRKHGEPGKKTLARIYIQERAERHAKLILRLSVKQGYPPARYLKRLDRYIRNFNGRRHAFKCLVANEFSLLGVSTFEPVNRRLIPELAFI